MMRWLFLIALIGCKRDDTRPATAPEKVEPVSAAADTAVAAGEACDVRVKRFGDRLAALAKERPGGRLPAVLPEGFTLVTSPAGKSVDAAGASVLAQKIPAAVAECKCNMTDLDVFEYCVLNIMGAFFPPVKYVAMPKLAASNKRTVGALVAR